jgi:hypothetical protein
MKSVRNLTLTLLATAALGMGSLQVARAQATNQGSSGQSPGGAQSQASPQGQATGSKQSTAANQQGAGRVSRALPTRRPAVASKRPVTT